jgi:hypothetical protein
MISMSEARKIDTMITGYGDQAIWSPTTSVVDTKAIMKYMVKEL